MKIKFTSSTSLKWDKRKSRQWKIDIELKYKYAFLLIQLNDETLFPSFQSISKEASALKQLQEYEIVQPKNL